MKNGTIMLLGLAALFFSCQTNTAERNNASPIFDHILVIVGDDHGFATVGAYGNSYIQTPGLDRLAAGGVRFEKAYATSPICSASRQSVLCGKYPHATGVNMLFTPFPDEGNITIAEHLREQGFATKNHFNNWVWGPLYKDGPPDHGFSLNIGGNDHREWLKTRQTAPIPDSIPTRSNQSGEGVAWQKNAAMLPVSQRSEDTEAAFFVDQALAFMQEQQPGKSLTWLAFHKPHAPFTFPVEYRHTYHADSLPFPKGSPEDERWVPEIFQDLTEAERRGPSGMYHRLYDLKNDPQKTTNLAYDPGQAQRVEALQSVMPDYFRQTHPDAADCPSSLNTLGQLVWFCESRDLGGDYQERPARIFKGEPFQPATPD